LKLFGVSFVFIVTFRYFVAFRFMEKGGVVTDKMN